VSGERIGRGVMAVMALAVVAIGAVSQAATYRWLAAGDTAGLNTVAVTDVGGIIGEDGTVTVRATVNLGFFTGPQRVTYRLRVDLVDAGGPVLRSATRDGWLAAGANSATPVGGTVRLECPGRPARVVVSVEVSTPTAAESPQVTLGPLGC
jgi:hypothetical protein